MLTWRQFNRINVVWYDAYFVWKKFNSWCPSDRIWRWFWSPLFRQWLVPFSASSLYFPIVRKMDTDRISLTVDITEEFLTKISINSLAPERYRLKLEIITLISRIDMLSIFCGITMRCMPQDPTVDSSTSAQVMAWCHQATSHYLSPCWPRFPSPYGITNP